MKILQVLPYFPPHTGGLEQVAEKLSFHLAKQGYEITNLVFSVGQTMKSGSYEKDGYQVIVLPAFDLVYSFPFPKFWKKSFWQGIQQVKQRNPDIIQTHTRFFLSSFLGGILAKIWGKKWVHVEHGGGFVEDISGWKRGIAWLYDQTLGRWVFKQSDKIVSISQANVNFITKFVPLRKIEVIHNGIEFSQQGEKKLLSKQISLTYVGRLAPGKGVHILLEAIKKVKKSDFFLSIIGDGDYRGELEDFVKNNRLDNVTFLGRKSHAEVVNFLIKETDILINPSFREGLPTTVLEGLLAKCVVIATDVGGTREISDKADLILVKPRDVDGLVDAIEETLPKVKQLQGLSWESVKGKFDWERNVGKYAEVYVNLLKK